MNVSREFQLRRVGFKSRFEFYCLGETDVKANIQSSLRCSFGNAQCMSIGKHEKYFAFVCTPQHHKYQNAKAIGEFVVNYPGPELIEKVSEASQFAENVDEVVLSGLTSIPSLVVKPPRIRECSVYLECKIVDVEDFDDGSIILGKVVSRSGDREISFQKGTAEENINLLSTHPLLTYVYPNHYALINTAEKFISPKNYKP